MAENDMVVPTQANGFDCEDPLTQEHVTQWKENGFAAVDGVLPQDLLEQVYAQASPVLENIDMESFGSGNRLVFPSASSPLANDVTLHPRLLRCVEQLLGTDNFQLTQSDLWLKVARDGPLNDYDSYDQRIHCDYPNHYLTHPPPWDIPAAVEMILYYDREENCGGGTAVVPREGPEDPAYQYPIKHLPGFGKLKWVNDIKAAEKYLEEVAPESAEFRKTHLYPRERRLKFNFGTLLLYRHDTWHRGTKIRAGKQRVVQNFTFAKPLGLVATLHPGWAWSMYRRDQQLEKLIGSITTHQRSVIGFPRPGDPYWTKETIEAVRLRYECFGIDMAPYEAALA